eukprot:GFKZ01004262.1.p1 GENE.GFKZ01004262.1~~GFKZ01004262.1.p1  ORF type:complete len:1103 (-),score=149.17 GFKZ01004262.1:2514-5822(-)
MTHPIPDGFATLPTYAAGQTLQGASTAPVLGHNGIQAWRHQDSGVRFVLFNAPGPLVSATIVVGTEPVSNAGHPHTLEHIIFLGSHKYPQRGYLDNLACRCLSEGTNAWTDNEYTAYTTKTAGFEGFSHLLPCFLDHVMRPRINAASFASEVYHIRADGKEAGVVFSEMQARENTEADLSDRALLEVLFADTSLALESGGLCKDIRTLSNEEVARFHYDQYCGANITVIVGGNSFQPAELLGCVKPLLDDISAQPGFSRGQPRWQTPLNLRPLPPKSRRLVHFPCPDEDIGTIILAWRGPGATSRQANLAIDVLLRYLVSDTWSPLRQQFVDTEEQLASEIYSSLDTYLEVSAVSLTFSGVEHLDDDDEGEDQDNETDDDDDETKDDDMEDSSMDTMDEDRDSFLLSGKMERQVMEFLGDIVQKGELPGGLRAIHTAINKEMESHLTELESGSHEAVPYHLIEEVVYGHRDSLVIGEETRGSVEAYTTLKTKTEDFWIATLKDAFVDAPRVEIVMVPDANLADKLAEEESQAISARVERLGAQTLARIAADNKEQISSLETQQFAADVFPPIPSTVNISRWPYTVTQEVYPDYNAQSVTLDTDFVHCTIFLDTTSLPLEKRAFLPILCQLILTCDILQEDGSYIPYTENSRSISEITVSTDRSGLSIGYNGDVAHQCMVIHYAAMPGSFAKATSVVAQTFFQSEITAERLSAVSQTLQANATSEMRDAETVLEASTILIPFIEAQEGWKGEIPNYVLTNVLGSYPLISFVSDEFTRKKPRKQMQRKVIRKMQETLNALRNLPSKDIFVQIASKNPNNAHKHFAHEWGVTRDLNATNIAPITREMKVQSRLPLSRRVCEKLEEVIGDRGVSKIIGIAGVESCSVDIRVDSPVFPGHADWSALSVLTEMLCRMEGPLCNAVRGAGLGYGVQITNAGFMGQLVGMIYDCGSPAAAWDAVCECLEDFRRSLDQGGPNSGLEVDLETAKASMLYCLNRGRSTPESIAGGALSRCALGAPASPMADRMLEEMVERVSLRSLADVFDRHMARLVRKESRVVVVTCGQGMVKQTIEGFRKCRRSIDLEEVEIEGLCPRQVQDVVKKLRKI